MNVTVIGMGKIGLPLAVNFAKNGAKVTGLDVQEVVVDQINSGIEPFPGEKDLGEFLKECVDNGSLVASLDKESFTEAFSFPPINHLAYGGCQSKVVFQGLSHCKDCACSPQKARRSFSA